MRLLTTFTLENNVQAFGLSDKWEEAQDNAEDWLWQDAISKEEAIAAHDKKFELYLSDIENEREPKQAY